MSKQFCLPAAALPLLLANAVHAQAINVDFGDPANKPQSSYAAQGLAGFWNTVGALPDNQRATLTLTNGFATAIRLYMAGGDGILTHDDPATSGDDQALFDDMLIGGNDPLDVCVWFENVPPGDYEIILYALTPGDPALQHRLRVDFGSPGPTMCGGAWAGFQQEGVSFVRFIVHSDNGFIGLHSGLFGGLFGPA